MRTLEGEVKELKDLLDVKDEKIDMLSRLQSNSPCQRRLSTTFSSSTYANSRTSSVDGRHLKEDHDRIHQSSRISDDVIQEVSSAGCSNGKLFIGGYRGSLRNIHLV